MLKILQLRSIACLKYKHLFTTPTGPFTVRPLPISPTSPLIALPLELETATM